MPEKLRERCHALDVVLVIFSFVSDRHELSCFGLFILLHEGFLAVGPPLLELPIEAEASRHSPFPVLI